MLTQITLSTKQELLAVLGLPASRTVVVYESKGAIKFMSCDSGIAFDSSINSESVDCATVPDVALLSGRESGPFPFAHKHHPYGSRSTRWCCIDLSNAPG